jgi:iron complex outermembrane receptor protein
MLEGPLRGPRRLVFKLLKSKPRPRRRIEAGLHRRQHAAGIGRGKEGGVSWSLAYYGASGDGLGQNSYGRTDFTLAKAITVPSARVRASATLSRLDNKTVTYFRDFGSTLENRYDSRLQLRAQLDVSF